MKEWGLGELFRPFAFVILCSVTSDMRLLTGEIVVISRSSLMLTQKPFTTWRVAGLSPLRGERKHHILPSMSHYNNLRLSENICIFFRDQPLGSIPRVCSRSITQDYCLTHLSRLKVATSSWSLFVCLRDFIEEQVKLEPFWGEDRDLWLPATVPS